MESCIFCKIIAREVSSEIVKETGSVLVFKDVKPKAPTHLLIVPKKHIKDFEEADDATWREVGEIAKELGKELGFRGYRLVHNVGKAAAVPHMHIHFLGEISADRAV